MKALLRMVLITLRVSPPKIGPCADIQGTRDSRALTYIMHLVPDAYLADLNLILDEALLTGLQTVAASDEDFLNGCISRFPTLTLFDSLKFIAVMVVKLYVKRTRSLIYEDDVVNEIVCCFIDDIKSNRSKYVRRSPLLRFNMDVDAFQIAPGVAIRRIQDCERNEWQDEDGPFRFRDLHAEFLLEQCFEADKSIVAPTPIIEEDYIVSLLKILKDEGLAMPLTEQRNVTFGTTGWHYPKYLVTGSFETDAYFELDEETKHRVKILYSSLMLLKSNARFNLALRRWSIGHERPDLTDRLVDWWIALEALFGTTDSTDQLSQSLALRISAYVGSRGTYGLEFVAAKEAYATRSKLVHGVPKAMPSGEPGRSRDLLRRSLFKMLDRNSVPSTDELDNAIRDHRTEDF